MRHEPWSCGGNEEMGGNAPAAAPSEAQLTRGMLNRISYLAEGGARTRNSREHTHLRFVAGSFYVGNADGFHALHLRSAKRTKICFQINQPMRSVLSNEKKSNPAQSGFERKERVEGKTFDGVAVGVARIGMHILASRFSDSNHCYTSSLFGLSLLFRSFPLRCQIKERVLSRPSTRRSSSSKHQPTFYKCWG